MDAQYITLGELGLLVGVFVGPFLLAGAVTQFLLLRRAGFRPWIVATMLLSAAILTLFLTWALMFVVPQVDALGFGGAFLVPGLLAAAAVSAGIGLLARFRRPAA
jgi:hypothetical protein